MEDIFSCFLETEVEHLFKKIYYSTCTMLKNLKPSEIFNINSKEEILLWKKYSSAISQTLGFRFMVLSEGLNNIVIFFYKKHLMKDIFKRQCVKKFLFYYGYKFNIENLEKTLELLRERYQQDNFPHEIGVFLGYPIQDVVGFIENKGKNFKICKYWKVYHDLDYCNKIFSEFDKIKEKAKKLVAI